MSMRTSLPAKMSGSHQAFSVGGVSDADFVHHHKLLCRIMFAPTSLTTSPGSAIPLPEAPATRPDADPRPAPEAPPQQRPDLDPFNPPWPAGRPEPQPKA
jgi:hypothetical protein